MTKKISIRLLDAVLALICVPLCVSCNVFTPFNGVSSVDDIIEVAQQCEARNDYACAVNNYLLLPDGATKTQRLCTAYMSKAGMTLQTVLNVVVGAKDDPKLLGLLANAVLPWNATKAADAASAITYCNQNAAPATSSTTDVLLQTVALLLDCSVRIAKTDQLEGNSTNDTVCTTAGNNDGVIDALDISQDNTGAITTRGMCKTDADACLTDILAIQGSRLGVSALSNIATAYNSIPPALKSAAATQVARAGIRTGVACPGGATSC